MADTLTGGYGPQLQGQFSGPEAFGFNPDVKAYPYDPARAKELLKEAGYPNGFEVAFQCTSYRYYKDREVCASIASFLSQVGITAKIEYLEGAVYLKTIASGQAAPMYIIGVNYGPHMDIDISFGQYMGWHSYALHDNKQLNALYDQANAARDPEQRKLIAQQMVALAREEALDLYIFQIPGVYGLSPRVDGLAFRPPWSMDLRNARITP
jgi:peptide/nickel transport system substrate-binding protein